MPKKEERLEDKHHPTKHPSHPIFRQKLTLGQKASDVIARFGGSWWFISVFFVLLAVWIGINTFFLMTTKPFDPYPFILLNLALSCLAAIQAPVILMSQNRQAERDRLDAKYDYAVNRKAERENRRMMKDLDLIKWKLREMEKR